MNSSAFIICAKDCLFLPECVKQIRDRHNNDIIIVDSYSKDQTCIKKIIKEYKNVLLHKDKNQNYEYGAILKAFNSYSDKYEAFIFIQDSIYLKKHLDLSRLSENTVLIFRADYSGWKSDPAAKSRLLKTYPGIRQLSSFVFSRHPMCIWNSFAVKTTTFKNILNSQIFKLTKPPKDKIDSRMWERIWAIIMIHNKIKIISISDVITKKYGKRI